MRKIILALVVGLICLSIAAKPIVANAQTTEEAKEEAIEGLFNMLALFVILIIIIAVLVVGIFVWIAAKKHEEEKRMKEIRLQQPVTAQPMIQQSPQIRFCPSCGGKLRPDWEVCGYCGRKLK